MDKQGNYVGDLYGMGDCLGGVSVVVCLSVRLVLPRLVLAGLSHAGKCAVGMTVGWYPS